MAVDDLFILIPIQNIAYTLVVVVVVVFFVCVCVRAEPHLIVSAISSKNLKKKNKLKCGEKFRRQRVTHRWC